MEPKDPQPEHLLRCKQTLPLVTQGRICLLGTHCDKHNCQTENGKVK